MVSSLNFGNFFHDLQLKTLIGAFYKEDAALYE